MGSLWTLYENMFIIYVLGVPYMLLNGEGWLWVQRGGCELLTLGIYVYVT
jgi:hypothetical protein